MPRVAASSGRLSGPNVLNGYQSMETSTIERLVAYAAPQRLPANGDETREQRNWVIRLARPVAKAWKLYESSMLLSADAAAAV